MFVRHLKTLIMLQLRVQYQENYSRIQLLLRIFFGAFYIYIPHFIVLFFVLIWSKILWIYSTFYILFTGRYPKSIWDFQMGLFAWLSRVHLSSYNLRDDYPAFGLKKEVGYLEISAPFNEIPSRVSVLLRFIFISLMILPHIFIWIFRNLWSGVLTFLAFWVVLFTGKYPKNWFDFNIGTLRWILRVMGYQFYIFDQYPPFTGKE
jgi:hypothetical protein